MRIFYKNVGTMTHKLPQMDMNPTQCPGYVIYFYI